MNTETTVDFNWNLTQSPFASVIQTNYVPSTEDLARLEALLAEPQLQLVQLELEVVRSSSGSGLRDSFILSPGGSGVRRGHMCCNPKCSNIFSKKTRCKIVMDPVSEFC